MLVFINGKFLPEELATVPVFDRSFCLGDGLFEALPVHNGQLVLWDNHLGRMRAGAEFLKIEMPFSPDAMRSFANELLQRNKLIEGMLRIQLSRGVGLRGYSPKGANAPVLVMTFHPFRETSPFCKIVTSSIRVPANDPLSRFKTCSKISHVLARIEADEKGGDEALLLNTDGHVAEATSSNLFWIENGTVCTPPLSSGALPGVTRGFVLDVCSRIKISSVEKNITSTLLSQTDAVFLTSSGSGIREVSQLDGRDILGSAITQTLRDAYLKHVENSD